VDTSRGDTKGLNGLEEILGYKFQDKNKLMLALTHSSYISKDKISASNERMEFLGDTILGFIVSSFLYSRVPILSEGQMTRIRASIVCEETLAQCALELKLGDFLRVSKGEALTGGRTRSSILSDAYEAVVGSIYLDGGMKACRDFVLSSMSNIIHDAIMKPAEKDYKTKLQEIAQRGHSCNIVYKIVNEQGPDHEKVFDAQVRLDGKVMGKGTGKTKKEAEQLAAKEALGKLNSL